MIDVYTEKVEIKGIKYTGTFEGQVCLKLEPFKKTIGQRVDIKDLSPGDIVSIDVTVDEHDVTSGNVCVKHVGYTNYHVDGIYKGVDE